MLRKKFKSFLPTDNSVDYLNSGVHDCAWQPCQSSPCSLLTLQMKQEGKDKHEGPEVRQSEVEKQVLRRQFLIFLQVPGFSRGWLHSGVTVMKILRLGGSGCWRGRVMGVWERLAVPGVFCLCSFSLII